MQRDGVLANEAWGKPATSAAYPDPLGNGRWSLDIYYQLLELRAAHPAVRRQRVRRAAQSGRLQPRLRPLRRGTDYEKWWENLRAGQVVVTNGPLIREPRFNGELPGHVFQAAAGETVRLQTTLNLSIREPVDYLEIVKDGEVMHDVRLDGLGQSGGPIADGRIPRKRLDAGAGGGQQSQDLPFCFHRPGVRGDRRPAADQQEVGPVLPGLGVRAGAAIQLPDPEQRDSGDEVPSRRARLLAAAGRHGERRIAVDSGGLDIGLLPGAWRRMGGGSGRVTRPRVRYARTGSSGSEPHAFRILPGRWGHPPWSPVGP